MRAYVDARAAVVEQCLRQAGTRGIGTHAVGVCCAGAQTVLTAWPAGERRIDGEPLFEIGSLTKVLTGTLLAELSLRGDVDLDDPLTRHLDVSQIPRWRHRAPTLEELATHRGALPNTPPPLARREMLAAAGVLRGDPWAGVGDAEYRRMLRAMAPRRAAGTRVRYSSMGFGLLGDALARRSGCSFEDLLRRRLCEPLGMTDTGIETGVTRCRLLAGHSRRGAERPPLRDAMPAAGAVRSSAADLLIFLRACLAPRGDLLGEALALAQQPRAKIGSRMSVGLGWLTLRRRRQPPIVWHNGATWGFRSFAALVPDRHLAIVVLSNTTRPLERLGFGLVDRLSADAGPATGQGRWRGTLV